MRPTTTGFYLLLSLMLTTVGSLFASSLMIRLILMIFSYKNNEEWNFNMVDVIYSAKISLGGGIPLAVGGWLLANFKAKRQK